MNRLNETEFAIFRFCRCSHFMTDPFSGQVLAFQKASGRLALSLYVFLPTACFHFELLELVHVDLF